MFPYRRLYFRGGPFAVFSRLSKISEHDERENSILQYHKYNIFGDLFTEGIRIKQKRNSDDLSPIEFYHKYKKEIADMMNTNTVTTYSPIWSAREYIAKNASEVPPIDAFELRKELFAIWRPGLIIWDPDLGYGNALAASLSLGDIVYFGNSKNPNLIKSHKYIFEKFGEGSHAYFGSGVPDNYDCKIVRTGAVTRHGYTECIVEI